MPRQIPPVLLGVLKSDEGADTAWVRLVWRLPSGELRYEAVKAVVVAKNDQTGEHLLQQTLVDVNGKPV